MTCELSVADLKDELLKLLECPVCASMMIAPIEQCPNGHILCSSCKTKLNKCPICTVPFSHMRNRVAENVAELILHVPCANKSRGCPISLLKKDILKHQNGCPFRPYSCKVCEENVSFVKLVEHFDQLHSANILHNSCWRTVANNEDKPQYYYTLLMKAHGEIFWFWWCNAKAHAFVGVTYAGTDGKPPNYNYHLHMITADKSCEMSFKGPVLTDYYCDVPPNTQETLIVNLKFLKEGAMFHVSIFKV